MEGGVQVPRTQEEVDALEASYVPFDHAADWHVPFDGERWQRHLDAYRTAASTAGTDVVDELEERFRRAAALDSSVLGELVRPVPGLTTVVLRGAVGESDWSRTVEANRIAIECHRRALVVAGDAAAAGRPLDEQLIARIQDLIVESQSTYTVSTEDGRQVEVDLPRRQYKPVSNFMIRFPSADEIVAFAPATRVADEMGRLVAELGSDAYAALHPVVQSAYLHVAITRIHPFADGNGRLARTLASMPLLRACGLSQLVLADQWPAYITALARADKGDVGPIVSLFHAAQVNTLDLASRLLGEPLGNFDQLPVGRPTDPRTTLLDLVRVHGRTVLEGLPTRWRVALTGASPISFRVVDDQGQARLSVDVSAERSDEGWLRLVASHGLTLDVAEGDVVPAPLEVVHLRVESWVDTVLRIPGDVGPTSRPGARLDARVRGLFVLGAPRSGTSLFGNVLGSHPDVLGLAEYGGFYVAHSVAPSYVGRLPGREHDGFLDAVRDVALRRVVQTAREQGRSWFCDATPWNLEVAGALAASQPDAVFVLMLRHFAGAVLSLREFPWAGPDAASAARLWVSLNACITQLPQDRTIVLGYDAFAADPAEVVNGLREALGDVGLSPSGYDVSLFAHSHAALVGSPRPTVASVQDGETVFRPIPSVDVARWTPDLHAQVWPVVADLHASLRETFPQVYVAPSRPDHVPQDQW